MKYMYGFLRPVKMSPIIIQMIKERGANQTLQTFDYIMAELRPYNEGNGLVPGFRKAIEMTGLDLPAGYYYSFLELFEESFREHHSNQEVINKLWTNYVYCVLSEDSSMELRVNSPLIFSTEPDFNPVDFIDYIVNPTHNENQIPDVVNNLILDSREKVLDRVVDVDVDELNEAMDDKEFFALYHDSVSQNYMLTSISYLDEQFWIETTML